MHIHLQILTGEVWSILFNFYTCQPCCVKVEGTCYFSLNYSSHQIIRPNLDYNFNEGPYLNKTSLTEKMWESSTYMKRRQVGVKIKSLKLLEILSDDFGTSLILRSVIQSHDKSFSTESLKYVMFCVAIHMLLLAYLNNCQ